MCLTTLGKKELIAEEDLVFYKLLDVSEDIFGYKYYYSYYRMSPVVLGEVYRDKYKHFGFRKRIDLGKNLYEVNAGGYHLFKKFEDADRVNKRHGSNGIIVKAIVPKGTRYVEGIFDYGNQDTEANSVVVKVVKYEKI